MYDFSQHTVLLIDDNELYRKFLNKVLSKAFSCVVFEVGDPKEASIWLNSNTPSLIILDMEMPVMDGYSYLKILRENVKTKDIPVVVCTSLSSVDLVVRLVKLKIMDYIDKKSDAKIITQKLFKVLNQL